MWKIHILQIENHSPKHLLLIVKHQPRPGCGASGAALAHERMAVLAERSENQGENSTDQWGRFLKKNTPNGYGSIPINTIFRGMNIHKSQLFWCSPGVQGFDTLPNGGRLLFPQEYGIIGLEALIFFCFFGHLVRCPAMPSARLGQGRRCEKKHCFGMCQKPFCLCASFLGWTSTCHLLWCVQKGGRVLTHTHLAENYVYIYNYI